MHVFEKRIKYGGRAKTRCMIIPCLCVVVLWFMSYTLNLLLCRLEVSLLIYLQEEWDMMSYLAG